MRMKIVVAIDSLKGCLSSVEANLAAREGLLRRFPEAEVVCVPVSDGGEGFVAAIASAVGGRLVEVEVSDPLMRPIRAHYLIHQRTAYIEMAQASGLTLLRPEERNPLIATSYGTGQLMADAVRRGAREMVVGLGGSATSDCGCGLLQALEREVPGSSLSDIGEQVRVVIATDVDNPLYGPQGAARVFARQKMPPPLQTDKEGLATAEQERTIALLDGRARDFARTSAESLDRDCSHAPGAGAAGGVGYALMQWLRAERRSGAEVLLEAARFDTLLQGADLVVTGEGRADRQTLMGKLPSVVLRYARQHHVPVCLVAGQVANAKALENAGFAHVLCINPESLPFAEAMRPDVAQRNLMHIIATSLCY